MSTEILQKSGYSLVKVTSERLDTFSAPDLKAEFVVLTTRGEKNIVLDLSCCKYCDSSGLRAILVGNRMCEDAIGTFILCGLQPDVEYLIKLSMLDTVLLIAETISQAEELLAKKGEL